MKKEKQHKFSEDDIIKYLDNDLNWIKKYLLSKHLAKCQQCEQTKNEYQLIAKALASKPEVNISPFFKEKTMAKALLYNMDLKSETRIEKFNLVPYIISIIIISIIIILLHFSKISSANLSYSFQLFLIYKMPNVYFNFRKFMEYNAAIYAIFKYYISYAFVLLISILALFYSLRHSLIQRKAY